MARETKLEEELQPNFLLGQMADDLVNMMIFLCTKDVNGKKGQKFPNILYSSYVDTIMKTALNIQESIFVANSLPIGSEERCRLQKNVLGKCVYLLHLIRIASDNAWISQKQRDRFAGLVVSIKYKTKNWMR